MDQANAQKDNGEREGAEGMSEQEKKMKELLGYKEFVNICEEKGKTYEDALKGTAKTEFGNAMARIIAIPSEIETMLFLHDQGKILYHLAIDEYMQSLNMRDGVDIVFADGGTFPGLTDQAFIDVKNVELKYDGTNYPNLFIELEGWGNHYTDGSTNRYIAYVRDGKRYGGKLASEETEAFSFDKTETENTRDIIKYYINHTELLDHDIYIVRGKHIGEKITAWKKTSEYTKNKRYYNAPLPNWRKEYPLMEVSRTADGWMVKNTGKEEMYLSTATEAQIIRENKETGSTPEQVEAGMLKYYDKLKRAQQGGLTEQEVLKIYGLIPEARVVWDRSEEEDLYY